MQISYFIMGIFTEIASYHFVDSFWHGEFMIQLYFNKLPLYMFLFYYIFGYHTYQIVKKFEIKKHHGILLESICVAFVTEMFFAIFDNIGPTL